jgi:hypothetical protein
VKRLLSLFLLSVMVPQLALASQVENLKSVLNEYTYSMEVIWDQEDQIYASQKRQELVLNLEKIVSAGISKEEIIEASGVKLDSISSEIEVRKLTNSNEIAEFLLQHKQFQKGANWVGDVVIATVFFTPIIVMIGLMIHGSLTREERLNKINSCLEANPMNQDHCFDLI